MRTLLNDRDQKELLDRLRKVRPDSQRRWGSMSAHQMICHLSDSLRAALGEKQVSSSSTPFKRTIYKWAALWVPLKWPHGIKTRPEMDQQQGGTRPAEFSSDVENLRILFKQFCGWKGDFVPHAMFGHLSRIERMRHGADRVQWDESYYCCFAYSALACFRMGMSGSAYAALGIASDGQ